jgi:RimJ/RimL family protein N-acetyltransferase
MHHQKLTGQQVIPAGRIVLRPLRPEDQGALTLHAGDERVARMTSTIPHPLPPGSTEAFIERALGEHRREHVWAIAGGPDAPPGLLGVISLKPLDAGQSEIGYWVVPAFWNTHIASEAVAALTGANPLGNRTIFASVFQDNPVSARVLLRNGFQYLGEAETYSVARAATVPTWTYLKTLG